AEDVAVAGRVGQLVGGVVGGDEAVLVEDHHRVPADGVDLLGGEDLTAPAGEEAPLVEGEADQATGLRVVDDVPDLGDVLPAADGHHRQAVDLGGGHQELHGLPRVAITPPDRRRRWTTMNATTATTRTTSTTMSHPRASMRLFFPGWAPAAAVTARAAPRPAAAAEPTPIPRPPRTGRRHVPAGALWVVTPSPTWQELERDMASVRTDTHAAARDRQGPTIAVLRWGAIFGDTAAALATWLLLYVLGLAIGFSSINQADLGSLKSLGLFSGLWSVIAPLPALFVGGFVVSRGAGATDRTTGALHGTVVWALSILGATWLVVNLLTGLVGGAFSAAKSTAQTAGQGVAGAAQAVGGGAANAAGGAANAGQGAGGAAGDLAKQFQLNPDDALRTVNARLQAAGKPTINPDQLQAAVKQALQSAVQQRSFDRQAFVKALEDNHLATGADADEIAGRVEG